VEFVKTEMMAAVLYGKEHLEVEPVAVPRIDRGDVLVRVRAALTCGTDVKVFRRGYHARMIVPPALFGHELAGDIVAVGEDVKGFRVGQRVVAANSAPCLECYYCKRGLENCARICCSTTGRMQSTSVSARSQADMYEIPAHVSYQDARADRTAGCVIGVWKKRIFARAIP
jgi:L-iditol 2-dehydrogenase